VKISNCILITHGTLQFFLCIQATARGEEGMTLFFVCCNPNCGYRWRDWNLRWRFNTGEIQYLF